MVAVGGRGRGARPRPRCGDQTWRIRERDRYVVELEDVMEEESCVRAVDVLECCKH